MHKVLNTFCLRIVVCGLLAGKDLLSKLEQFTDQKMSCRVLSWLKLRLYGEWQQSIVKCYTLEHSWWTIRRVNSLLSEARFSLAKRTRKSTQVLDLRSTCARLATHLRRLATTCDDLRGFALTLVELKFGRKLATQHKSTQVDRR